MKALIFGGQGGLAAAIRSRATSGPYRYPITDVVALSKRDADVRHTWLVGHAVQVHQPDFVINCAGLTDFGQERRDVLDVNLFGALNVSLVCAEEGVPCLLIGSTAGMQAPAQHPWYGPAKAGVIAHVAAAGKAGQPIWCLSPNRMDTPMRQRDWPDEDPRTRLNPLLDVVPVIERIMDGQYLTGANVVVRKVGTSGRVDVFQAPTVWLPGMLDV